MWASHVAHAVEGTQVSGMEYKLKKNKYAAINFSWERERRTCTSRIQQKVERLLLRADGDGCEIPNVVGFDIKSS